MKNKILPVGITILLIIVIVQFTLILNLDRKLTTKEEALENTSIKLFESQYTNKEQESLLGVYISENEELSDAVISLELEKSELLTEIEDGETDKHEIEIAFENALDSWDGNTTEGVLITNTYSELWAQEIDKYYKLLEMNLEEERQNSLVLAQEKWLEFSKAQEALSWNISDQNFHGGSIMRLETAIIAYNKNKNRALDLMQNYADLMIEDLK